ncbi:uncharacterized protein LOC126282475 [Schistocerca gregaria]|uniref:uncharacterized protein LOC126282475 n=1 Tax=Schistocerca gregaria TaxID=7010 RepID=UPI00211F1E96|nr:uncharacterized protein LOC126282475 [Schistocerca gregaria]
MQSNDPNSKAQEGAWWGEGGAPDRQAVPLRQRAREDAGAVLCAACRVQSVCRRQRAGRAPAAMATELLLLASVLAAAASGGAEPWDVSESAWECAGGEDSAEATEDWPSRLQGLWVSQGCEPPQEWGGPWSLRSLLLESQPTAGAGAGASVRATLVTHVYVDEWCALPLYSVAVVATLLQERRQGDEGNGEWSVRMDGATGCGHSWEGVRRVLGLCCACAFGRHAKPHRELTLYSRGQPQRGQGGGEHDNVASRRHAELV